MITASDVLLLSKAEKLSVMELIWSDLASTSDAPDSPRWHENELKKTAARVEAGDDVPVDWSDAKRSLRDERR